MKRLNRDTIIAVCLLAVCGFLFWSTLGIRNPDYGTLPPSTWPRVILSALSILCFIYLVQSIRQGPDDSAADDAPKTLRSWLSHWQNVIWCFALFLAYLLTMPTLGMLIGGTLFVFLLLNALGGWRPRAMALHAAIACIAVGGMWSIFTYSLGVILPPGEIFSAF